MRIASTLAAGLALAGCAGQSTSGTTTAQAVYALGVGLQAAELAEAGYAALPGASPSAVATIKADDATAYGLVQPLVAAEAAGTSPAEAAIAAAQSALAALQDDLAHAKSGS